MTGLSDSNRSESPGGGREARQPKEGCSKDTTVGTQTGSEAATRAISVLGSAKSNSHRKTRRVEPDGTGRKFTRLTRGDPERESVQGVSRSHSSVEGGESRRSEGLKNQRRLSADSPPERRRVVPRNSPEQQLRRLPAVAGVRAAVESAARNVRAEASPGGERKEAKEDA